MTRPAGRTGPAASSFSGYSSTRDVGGRTVINEQVGTRDFDRVIQKNFGDIRLCMLAEGAGDWSSTERPEPVARPRAAGRPGGAAARRRPAPRDRAGGQRTSWQVGGTERAFDAAAQQWRDRMLAALDTTWEISSLRGEVSTLAGEISSIRGEESSLRGEISSLQGEVSSMRGRQSSDSGRGKHPARTDLVDPGPGQLAAGRDLLRAGLHLQPLAAATRLTTGRAGLEAREGDRADRAGDPRLRRRREDRGRGTRDPGARRRRQGRRDRGGDPRVRSGRQGRRDRAPDCRARRRRQDRHARAEDRPRSTRIAGPGSWKTAATRRSSAWRRRWRRFGSRGFGVRGFAGSKVRFGVYEFEV